MAAGGEGTTMRILRIGAVFVLAAIASSAWAADVSVGGVSIALPAPAGFCELSAGQPLDNRALTTIGGLIEKMGNRLLGASADCRQLADWRAAKRPLLDDYATFQVRVTDIDRVVASPKAFIHEACATMRAQEREATLNAAPDFKSKIEGALTNVKMNSLEFVGVLAEDDTACYAAHILKARAQSGADKTQIRVLSVSVVKSKAIRVTRHAVYRDADATSALLAKLQDTV